MTQQWRLSKKEFAQLALDFVSRMNAAGEHWFWHPDQYLVRTNVLHRLPLTPTVLFDTTTTGEQQFEDANNDELPEIIPEEEDPAELKIARSGQCEWLFDYHIVWSLVYSVPTLYFNCKRPDGSIGALCVLDDAIQFFSKQRITNQGVFPALIQEDHPHLNIPYFCFHPCNTSALMDLVLQNKNDHSPTLFNQKRNDLLTWLSLVGPFVGVRVPTDVFLPPKPTVK